MTATHQGSKTLSQEFRFKQMNWFPVCFLSVKKEDHEQALPWFLRHDRSHAARSTPEEPKFKYQKPFCVSIPFSNSPQCTPLSPLPRVPISSYPPLPKTRFNPSSPPPRSRVCGRCAALPPSVASRRCASSSANIAAARCEGYCTSIPSRLC